MKAFMKTCCIIVLFLLGFGIALTVAGCALGGADKVSEVVKDVTGGKVDVSLDPRGDFVGVTVGNLSSDDVIEKVKGILDSKVYDIDDYGSMYDKDQATYGGDVEKFTFPEEDVEKLKIDLGGCTLNVIYTSENEFAVDAKNVDKMQAYVKGDTLHVISTRSGSIKGAEIKKSVVNLYVPKDASFDEAEIEMGAGVLHVDSLEAEKLKVELGAGEAQLKNLSCEKLEVKVAAGSIKFLDAISKKLEVKIGAGSFFYEGAVDGDVKVSCSAGSTELKLTNKEEDFDQMIECSAGSVKVGSRTYSGLSKTQKIDNDADADLEIKCSAGGVQVSFGN